MKRQIGRKGVPAETRSPAPRGIRLPQPRAEGAAVTSAGAAAESGTQKRAEAGAGRGEQEGRRIGGDPIADRVLHVDNHIIIVSKAPSEIVQADKTGDATLADAVKAWLKGTFDKPGQVYLGIPHRLDRPTSGAVVFARTEKALARLSRMFRDREIEKIYWAAVDGLPPEPEGELRHSLIRDAAKNKSFAVSPTRPGAKPAVLRYRLAGKTKSYAMLAIVLETGRHHQIRAQLAAVGLHIKGDLKYGAARSNPGGGISLHARRVRFTHPVSGKLIDVTAPFPPDPVWNDFRTEPSGGPEPSRGAGPFRDPEASQDPVPSPGTGRDLQD